MKTVQCFIIFYQFLKICQNIEVIIIFLNKKKLLTWYYKKGKVKAIAIIPFIENAVVFLQQNTIINIEKYRKEVKNIRKIDQTRLMFSRLRSKNTCCWRHIRTYQGFRSIKRQRVATNLAVDARGCKVAQTSVGKYKNER